MDESALIQSAEEVDVRPFAVVLDTHARCIDSTTETSSIALHLDYHVSRNAQFSVASSQ